MVPESPDARAVTRTIGILRAVRSPQPANQEVLLATMAEGGWVEGDNLIVLGRDPGEVHPDRAAAEAVVAGWASEGVDLVVALSSLGALAAEAASPETIVLFLSNDPRATGLVDSERSPEGRLTGVTFRVPADRTLDLVRRTLPGVRRVGFLYPAGDAAAVPTSQAFLHRGARLGMELVIESFTTEPEIPGAVARLRQQGAEFLVLANAPTTVRAFPAIEEATAGLLPVATNVEADFALLVLEPDAEELYRQMGRQAATLLSGTPVSEVPVEDPARFRLSLNTEVARSLGIEIPANVLDSADRVVG